MDCPCPRLVRANLARRFADQSGLTLVEMLVAAVLLVSGVLGTFSLVDIANRTDSAASSREGATNIAREILEAAHGTPFARIGQTDWLRPRLGGLADASGGVSAPNAYTNQLTLVRRSTTYAVTLTWCSVDDARDGYGSHDAGARWCSDSASAGTVDPQAADLKRVEVQIAWTANRAPMTLDQVATFSASGAAVGPAVSGLAITSPSGTNPTAPTISANPAGGIVTLRGSSAGAAGMVFTVDGAEQQAGITAAGGGAWTFDWNIAALKDGVYTIGAIAVDALGTRGDPRTLQVTLNRGAPARIANLTAGYNYVTIGSTRTLILESAWDANAEGAIIGYEVLRGTTVVCPTSLATTCADLNAPQSGSTTYTFRTWYRDGAGVAQSISTALATTAPTITNIATQYHLTYDSATPAGSSTGAGCRGGTGAGTKFDMRSAVPAFGARSSGSGWVSGCLPPFPAGVSMSASSMNFAAKWTNSTSSSCNLMPLYLYLNGTTLIAGTGVNSGPPIGQIAKSSTTSLPASTTNDFTTSARSFVTSTSRPRPGPSGTWSAPAT